MKDDGSCATLYRIIYPLSILPQSLSYLLTVPIATACEYTWKYFIEILARIDRVYKQEKYRIYKRSLREPSGYGCRRPCFGYNANKPPQVGTLSERLWRHTLIPRSPHPPRTPPQHHPYTLYFALPFLCSPLHHVK